MEVAYRLCRSTRFTDRVPALETLSNVHSGQVPDLSSLAFPKVSNATMVAYVDAVASGCMVTTLCNNPYTGVVHGGTMHAVMH